MTNSSKFKNILHSEKVIFSTEGATKGQNRFISYTFNHLDRMNRHRKKRHFSFFLGKLGLAKNRQILWTKFFRDFPLSILCNFDDRIQICGYVLFTRYALQFLEIYFPILEFEKKKKILTISI